MKSSLPRSTLSRWPLAFGCAFLLLALVVHRPLPPGFTRTPLDRLTMHVVEPALRLAYYWPSRAFFNTTSGMVWWTRLVLNNLSRLIGPMWDNDSQMSMETTYWRGVKVRVYAPLQNATTRGAVIFIHGGGFALGNIEMYESLTRRMAKMLNTVLVSIDYRLSPETPYPGGLHDCEHVIEHFISIAEAKYNVDVNKMVIMGDSAGGNLAAVISQRRVVQNKKPELAGQALIYPLLQMADMQSLSYRYFQKNLNGLALVDPESVALYYMFYAGIDMDEHQHLAKYVLTNGHVAPHLRETVNEILDYSSFDHMNYTEELPPRAEVEEHSLVQEFMAPWLTNPDFSPLMRKNLTGLPRSFVMTCEFDVLRDEGVMYAKRLQAAGVPTHFRNYENGFHAMLNFHNEIQEASNSLHDIVNWTRDVLSR